MMDARVLCLGSRIKVTPSPFLSPVRTRRAFLHPVLMTFVGVSASVALYGDARGSTAQLLVDGQTMGQELNTVIPGVHWNATCRALLATTPSLSYGHHSISIVKSQDVGFLWIGNFT